MKCDRKLQCLSALHVCAGIEGLKDNFFLPESIKHLLIFKLNSGAGEWLPGLQSNPRLHY